MPKQKIIYSVFLALTVIFSLVGWFSLKGVFYNGSATTGVLIVALIFLFLGVVLGLIFLFFNSFGLLIVAPALSIVTSFLFFGTQVVYLIIFILGLGLVALAARQALQEKKVHVKIQPTEIVKPALGAIFTVLALIISAVIYFSPPAQGISVEIKVPRPLFDFVLGSMTSVAPSGLFSSSQILNKETEDKLYQAVNNQINFFLQPYKRYLPYGLVVAVFLSLKAISIIFVWLAIAIIQVAFILMKKMKLVSVRKEMAEKEVIEI